MTKNDFEDLGFLANAFSISSNGSIVEVSKVDRDLVSLAITDTDSTHNAIYLDKRGLLSLITSMIEIYGGVSEIDGDK